MSMKIYLNADPNKSNQNNIIQGEEIRDIEINKEISLVHDIFFAEDLVLYTDPLLKTTSVLRINVDYGIYFQDTIASDQSNRSCYRRIVFYKEYETVYVDYHAYGDIISAKDINNVYENTENAVKKATDALDSVNNHIEATTVHGATPNNAADKIVLRDSYGTFEIGEPRNNNNPIRLSDYETGMQNVTQAIESEASERVDADTALQANIETEVAEREAADEALDSNLREYVDQKILEVETNTSVPVGFVYIQLPGKVSPDDLFEGTWSIISAEFSGAFFRTEGGESLTFESGLQGSMNLSHTHYYPFSRSASGSYNGIPIAGNNAGNGPYGTYTSASGGVESRPINYTVRIWERIL